jgi:hypothetical protein
MKTLVAIFTFGLLLTACSKDQIAEIFKPTSYEVSYKNVSVKGVNPDGVAADKAEIETVLKLVPSK